MIKRSFQIILFTVLLAIFLYQGVQRDFPFEYLITLVVCYVAVIVYRIIKVMKYKRSKVQLSSLSYFCLRCPQSLLGSDV